MFDDLLIQQVGHQQLVRSNFVSRRTNIRLLVFELKDFETLFFLKISQKQNIINSKNTIEKIGQLCFSNTCLRKKNQIKSIAFELIGIILGPIYLNNNYFQLQVDFIERKSLLSNKKIACAYIKYI